jgi:hypothetical protein
MYSKWLQYASEFIYLINYSGGVAGGFAMIIREIQSWKPGH